MRTNPICDDVCESFWTDMRVNARMYFCAVNANEICVNQNMIWNIKKKKKRTKVLASPILQRIHTFWKTKKKLPFFYVAENNSK